MKNLQQNFKRILNKTLFEQRCSMCNCNLSWYEEYLCKDCMKYLEDISTLKKINNLYYIFYYNNNLKALISNYKFKNRRGIGEVFSNLVNSYIREIIKVENIDVVIPVPISKEREKERGFNQIEEILDLCNIKYDRVKREKNTLHLSLLKNEEERKKELKGAFHITKDYSNKKVLIVDDIVTTGSTIKEIEESLRKTSKDVKVIVFTLTLGHKYLKERIKRKDNEI